MAAAMGIPVPLGAHGGLRHRRGHGGGQRRALRPAGRRHPDDGLRLHAARLHRGGGGRHGQPRRLDPGRRSSSACWRPTPRWCEPGPGRHRVVRGADPHPALPAHRPLRADARNDTPRRRSRPPPATGPASRVATGRLRSCSPLWRPLVLPRVLAALRHRDPHLGPAGDVLGHPHRLHGHGLVRPLGVLRARHVRRRRRPAHRQAAEPLAGHALRAGGRRRRWRCSWRTSPPACATSTSRSPRSSSRRSST